MTAVTGNTQVALSVTTATCSGSVDNISVRELDAAQAPDKMTVFAGVRKLSDAASGMVTELSSSIFSFPGAFNLLAPSGAFANYQFSSAGSAIAAVAPTGFAAPITNVLTGISNISGDVVTLRANGVQAATAATDQGTGNYGNYPLFIGARGGSSTFFSGHLYSLIVRGSSSSSILTSATEGWVASKTGVVIA
jgi:hypothetical protein